jgi:hypothetical protein
MHANPADERLGHYLFIEIDRTDKEIQRLNERRGILLQMQQLLRICPVCTGSGTQCVGRTADDMPDYQPCRGCKGKGHGRN